MDMYVPRMVIDLARCRSAKDVCERLSGYGLDPGRHPVLSARLRFEFADAGRSRSRTVSLNAGGRTNLCDTPRDRIIRRYLQEWGIDAGDAAAVAVPPLTS